MYISEGFAHGFLVLSDKAEFCYKVTDFYDPADESGIVHTGADDTSIFIYPGYRFKVMDGLITNFHLPESTLVMLVSAFAGRERVLGAYEEAIRLKYRFFSFGDACFFY